MSEETRENPVETPIDGAPEGTSLEERLHYPRRVGIIDGNLPWMRELLEFIDGVDADIKCRIIQDPDDLSEHRPFDYVLIDDPLGSEKGGDPEHNALYNAVKAHSPSARLAFLMTEDDASVAIENVHSALERGAITSLLKQEAAETGISALRAYDRACRGPDGKVKKSFDKSEHVEEIESRLRVRFGPYDSCSDDILKISHEAKGFEKVEALCYRAIHSFYTMTDPKNAIALVDRALKIMPNENLPNNLRGELITALRDKNTRRARVSFARSMNQPALDNSFAASRIEEDIRLSELENTIRPSQGNITKITLDLDEEEPIRHLVLHRREDPSRETVQREYDIYRFYERIQKHIPRGQGLCQVPRTMAVLKAKSSSNWASYREWRAGSTLLKRLRDQKRVLRKNDDAQEQSSLTQSLKNSLHKSIAQAAVTLAFSPVSLGKRIKDPERDYYLPRTEVRVIEYLNRFFREFGETELSDDEQRALIEFSMPFFQHLSSLDTVWYKDMWYDNTLTTHDGWYIVDFGNPLQLPLVIDLATRLAYGDFSTCIDDGDYEEVLVDQFFETYAQSVRDFNNVVKRYLQDRKRFVLDEIVDDMKKYSRTDAHELKKLHDYVFKTMRNTRSGVKSGFKRVRRKIQNGSFAIPVDYVNELDRFVRCLREKSVKGYPRGHDENAKENFRLDYAAAEYHRALLLAGTFGGFVVRPDKTRYNTKLMLMQEMYGTMSHAVHGARRAYDGIFKKEGTMTKNQYLAIRRTCEGIMGRISSAHRSYSRK